MNKALSKPFLVAAVAMFFLELLYSALVLRFVNVSVLSLVLLAIILSFLLLKIVVLPILKNNPKHKVPLAAGCGAVIGILTIAGVFLIQAFSGGPVNLTSADIIFDIAMPAIVAAVTVFVCQQK